LRICVDFYKLNAATKKDPYPLPFIDEVLNAVIGYALYMFLDGFCGYNQLLVAEQDKYKSVFMTEWGTFVCLVMSFGLKNALATYQRAVNKAFREYLNKFMKLFLDDFSVHFDEATHLPKLQFCFEKCREFGISLNPEKCLMMVTSSIILGHVVSKDDKFPNPKKIQAIQDMPRPQRPANVQVFNGLAQFNRCYIKDYARIMEPITRLMCKTEEFNWTDSCEATWKKSSCGTRMPPILIAPKWELELHVSYRRF
jgi:hypothetical protein